MADSEFSARCIFGFEDVLAAELKNLGISRVRPLKGGVAFFGSLEDAYRICLWSRCATHVILMLGRFDAADADSLYAGARDIPWEEIIAPGATIAIRARGGSDSLSSVEFIALKVKDALCDRMRNAVGERPSVDRHQPGALIRVSVKGHRVSIGFDLSGPSLGKRGYADGEGEQSGDREVLAASLLVRAGWPSLSTASGSLVDLTAPFSVAAIEAASMSCDRAPGLLRDRWGFFGLASHDDDGWSSLLEDADDRAQRCDCAKARIVALAADSGDAKHLESCAKRAGVSGIIRIECDADPTTLMDSHSNGIVFVRDAQGRRDDVRLPSSRARLARIMGSIPSGWKLLGLVDDGVELDALCSIEPSWSGEVREGRASFDARLYDMRAVHRRQLVLDEGGTGKTVKLSVLEANTEQFAGRFKKMVRERRKWARRSGVYCYRIYDADLPDYAVAIDWYEGESVQGHQRCLVVQEYRAPASVDAVRARRRLDDVLAVAPVIAGIPCDRLFLKQRERAKGGSQYRTSAVGRSFELTVEESGCHLLVDLAGHLDTGLFLDHRDTRALVGQLAQGKSFLNLFAYTGAATVVAAHDGARETTTVDLSQTYLDWAQRNMRSNGFSGTKHRFVRADVLSWITQERRSRRRYEVVFVDPPTFSNSKAMGKRSWSVQRDHVELLVGVSRLLAPEGVAVFSCNLRDFKPETEELARLGVSLEDVTPQTIPEDFKRNAKIHHCYMVRHAR